MRLCSATLALRARLSGVASLLAALVAVATMMARLGQGSPVGAGRGGDGANGASGSGSINRDPVASMEFEELAIAVPLIKLLRPGDDLYDGEPSPRSRLCAIKFIQVLSRALQVCSNVLHVLRM